jgi:cyclic pyranopterin phosphate synthase
LQEWTDEQRTIFGTELLPYHGSESFPNHPGLNHPNPKDNNNNNNNNNNDHDDDEEEEDHTSIYQDVSEEQKEERELLFAFTSHERAAWGDIPTKDSMKRLLDDIAQAREAAEAAAAAAADTTKTKQPPPPPPPPPPLDHSSTTTSTTEMDKNETTQQQSQSQPQQYQQHHESFSHVSDDGNSIHMVDVGNKKVTPRMAHAQTKVLLPPSVLKAFGVVIHDHDHDHDDDNNNDKDSDIVSSTDVNELIGPKGPIFATAKIAGIMAAKNTSNIIPLCHPLPLDQVQIDIRLDVEQKVIVIDCQCRVNHKTGVEMEALMGASVAALTIYDMTKAVSHEIRITDTTLIAKTGGKRKVG